MASSSEEEPNKAVSKVPKYFVQPQVVTFEGLGGSADDDGDANDEGLERNFEKEEEAGINKLPEYIYSIAYQCLRCAIGKQ